MSGRISSSKSRTGSFETLSSAQTVLPPNTISLTETPIIIPGTKTTGNYLVLVSGVNGVMGLFSAIKETVSADPVIIVLNNNDLANTQGLALTWANSEQPKLANGTSTSAKVAVFTTS